MMQALRLGIAGLGVASTLFLPGVEAYPEARVVAAADRRPEALAAFAARYGGRTYGDVADLCADPEVDVVWIATPNQYHCEHTVLAAEHKKHVICTKPMALNVAEAERMCAAAERNGVQLLCGQTWSMSPDVQAMLGPSCKSSELRPPHCNEHVALHRLAAQTARRGRARRIARRRRRVPARSASDRHDPFARRRRRSQRACVHRALDGGTPVRGKLFGVPRVRGRNAGYDRVQRLRIFRYVGADVGYRQPDVFRRRAGCRAPVVQRRHDPADAAAKDALRFGAGANARPSLQSDGRESSDAVAGTRSRIGWFGLTIASCERGDVRQSPNGLYVYDKTRAARTAGLRRPRYRNVGDARDARMSRGRKAHRSRWTVGTSNARGGDGNLGIRP